MNHDCAVNITDDVLAVAQAFGDRNGPNYTLDKDRTYVGPNDWNLGPPDGFINQPVDVLHVAHQFGHTCGPLPLPSDYTTYNTYDAENRLATKTESGATTSYYYGATGALAKKVDGSGTTTYVEDLYEKQLTSGQETKYYWFAGRRVAMNKGGTLSYLLADHLGSSTTALDTSGNITALTKYYPYGRVWYDRTQAMANVTDKLFTGQQAEGSIYYMKARFYPSASLRAGSPVIGRFLPSTAGRQPDTIVPEPGNPQALNRYSYVYNNPLRYTDPTGRDPISDLWMNCFVLGCGTSPEGEPLQSAPPTELTSPAAPIVAPALPVVPAQAPQPPPLATPETKDSGIVLTDAVFAEFGVPGLGALGEVGWIRDYANHEQGILVSGKGGGCVLICVGAGYESSTGWGNLEGVRGPGVSFGSCYGVGLQLCGGLTFTRGYFGVDWSVGVGANFFPTVPIGIYGFSGFSRILP